MHLRLKSGRAECKPVLALAIDQETLPRQREVLEPLQRLLLRRIGDGHGNIHTLIIPVELRRQEDDPGLVGTKPVGQRACWHEPAAMEALAGVEWPPFIDQTTVTGTVRAGAAWIDRDTVDLDL